MGILLLWFSRGLSTCALLSEETGQLINRPGNAMARIHQVWMKSLESYVQPHPQGFSPYLKRTLGVFLGWFGTIDASPGCSVMWKSDVQLKKKTRSFLFYFCVVKVCYKDVVGLLPCLRVKASICPFMASETFSSRWSRLPVLRFCERRESCEKIKRLLKKQWNMHGQHAFIEIIMLGTITAMSLWSWKRQFWKQYRHSSEVGNSTEHIVSNFKTSSGIGKCRQMKIYSLSFKLGVENTILDWNWKLYLRNTACKW